MKITIIGDQVDRLELLRQLIDKDKDWTVRTIPVKKLEDIESSKSIHQSKIAIIDLAYVSEAAPIFIKGFRKRYPDVSILGIHFYKNPKLIEPLVAAGIDGYIHSNSRKNVIHEALTHISEGKRYLPG